MPNEQVAFGILACLGVFLIIIGFQGNLGTVFAIVFCPSIVVIQDT
jgi:hypothetical protein